MTDLLGSLVALLIAGLLNGLIIATIQARCSRSQAALLVRLYLTALLLRSAMAIVLNMTVGNSTVAAAFWGDSGTYDAAGDLLARRWQGEATTLAGQTQALSGYGFVYYVATIYYLCGRNQLLIQLLNATIGSLTVLVVYAIGGRLFGDEVGRWSARFMTFFPQMLFWSAGMYKDPSVLFCIALSMLAVLRLREAFSLGMAAQLGVAAVGLLVLRFYIFYFVALAALGTFVFGQKGPLLQRLMSHLLVLGAFVGAFTFAVERETLEAQRAIMTLDQMQITRQDQAMWGRSAFGTEYDVSTPVGALRALPTGLVYLLFAPFPWAIAGVRQLLTLPETLVWYSLMPAFVRGLAYSIRRRLRDVLPILVFMVTLTIAYALMQGNIGTAYRQRTQVTMFFFVFMAVGLVRNRLHVPNSSQLTLRGPEPAVTTGAAAILDHDFVYDIQDHDFVYDDGP